MLSLGEIIMVIYATFRSKIRALRVTLATLVAGMLMFSFSVRVWAGGDIDQDPDIVNWLIR